MRNLRTWLNFVREKKNYDFEIHSYEPKVTILFNVHSSKQELPFSNGVDEKCKSSIDEYQKMDLP